MDIYTNETLVQVNGLIVRDNFSSRNHGDQVIDVELLHEYSVSVSEAFELCKDAIIEEVAAQGYNVCHFNFTRLSFRHELLNTLLSPITLLLGIPRRSQLRVYVSTRPVMTEEERKLAEWRFN